MVHLPFNCIYLLLTLIRIVIVTIEIDRNDFEPSVEMEKYFLFAGIFVELRYIGAYGPIQGA